MSRLGGLLWNIRKKCTFLRESHQISLDLWLRLDKWTRLCVVFFDVKRLGWRRIWGNKRGFHHALRWLDFSAFWTKQRIDHWWRILNLWLNQFIAVVGLWTESTGLTTETHSSCHIRRMISQKYSVLCDWKLSFSVLFPTLPIEF